MSRRLRLVLLIGFGFVLLASWPFITHFRAKAMVRHFRQDLRAQGEKLGIGELTPHLTAEGVRAADEFMKEAIHLSPIASDLQMMRPISPGFAAICWGPAQDAAASNFWAKLAQTLGRQSDELEHLRATLEAPSIEFDMDYAQSENLPAPQLLACKLAQQNLAADAMLALREGKPAECLADLRAMIGLVRAFDHEPLMLVELFRLGGAQAALTATWEALQSKVWTDDDLRDLQARWRELDLQSQAESILAMSRPVDENLYADARSSFSDASTGSAAAAWKEVQEAGSRLMHHPRREARELLVDYPRFWTWKYWSSYDDELVDLQILQAGIGAVRASRRTGSLGPQLRTLGQQLTQIRRAHPKAGSGRFSCLFSTATPSFLERIEAVEMQRALLLTAIALERNRLRQGAYPSDLSALVPAYLPAVPLDPVDGHPLRYRLRPDGSFLLYSIGLDERDDGGNGAPAAGAKVRSTVWWHGQDAVWPMAEGVR